MQLCGIDTWDELRRQTTIYISSFGTHFRRDISRWEGDVKGNIKSSIYFTESWFCLNVKCIKYKLGKSLKIVFLFQRKYFGCSKTPIINDEYLYLNKNVYQIFILTKTNFPIHPPCICKYWIYSLADEQFQPTMSYVLSLRSVELETILQMLL